MIRRPSPSFLDKSRADAPRAATELGLTDRYRYLLGRSGKRYLFSTVPVERLGEYPCAIVVLEPTIGRGGRPKKAWIGEIDRDGKRRGARLASRDLSGRMALVHLLAGDAAQRRTVLDDLDGLFEPECEG
ncbi:hypothetical protein LC092_11850 [Stappia stellulata]|uniref:hypothetical protein n=1 Tax=Stappia stellulata TaxID=71235 RepID=UPI001CD313E0|nr:hypothetical protein [Stappia stellulata]MCA1243134.1 hypothetical protein [Stappia stellulata]